MARTTESQVESIIEVGDDDDITGFIESANVVVTDNCVTYPDGTATGYSDATLEMIERWLAAHLYAVMRPSNLQEEIGGPAATAKEVRDSKVGLGLDLTRWGQQVKLFDSKGTLTTVGKGKVRLRVNWLGTPNDET